MTGRPSEYSEDMAAAILAGISAGVSLNKLCKSPEMPSITTVFKWMLQQEAFAAKYARAQEERATIVFEEAVEIADDVPGAGSGDVNRDRLRVDTRKWFLARMSPRKYGDKLAIGGDTEAGPIQVTWAQPKPLQIDQD